MLRSTNFSCSQTHCIFQRGAKSACVFVISLKNRFDFQIIYHQSRASERLFTKFSSVHSHCLNVAHKFWDPHQHRQLLPGIVVASISSYFYPILSCTCFSRCAWCLNWNCCSCGWKEYDVLGADICVHRLGKCRPRSHPFFKELLAWSLWIVIYLNNPISSLARGCRGRVHYTPHGPLLDCGRLWERRGQIWEKLYQQLFKWFDFFNV